jgi:phage/plasmid primase-like uncharacterized protein
MENNTEKKRAGRPRKQVLTENIAEPIPKAGDPCRVCGGTGLLEDHDEDGNVTDILNCEWCNGSGIEPGEDEIAIEEDQVTDDDILAIAAEVGFHTPAWGFVDPKKIAAACVSVIGSKLMSRAFEGKGPR